MNFFNAKIFSNMPQVGKQIRVDEENEKISLWSGRSYKRIIRWNAKCRDFDEQLNERGINTALQRIAELVDEGTWHPLNTLYNPEDFSTGTVELLKG